MGLDVPSLAPLLQALGLEIDAGWDRTQVGRPDEDLKDSAMH